MPGWQPNWQAVRWNHEAANQAAAALDRAAHELEQTITDRMRSAQVAQVAWVGAHRNTFDRRHDEDLRQARTLAADFRDAARRIRSTSQEAREEQNRRLREQERWKREKADEERRQRDAEERQRREAEARQRRR